MMERTERKMAGTPSPGSQHSELLHGETRHPPDNRKGRSGHSSPTEGRRMFRPILTSLWTIAKKAWEAPCLKIELFEASKIL